MDNKEAIWRIKDHMIVHSLNEEKAIKITEALEMAIKALEKEDCENAVSAKAVEDMLFALPTYGDSYISLPEFMHEFKKLPPVTPTPVWTRITDRLPESGKDVLFCDIDGDIFLGHYNSQQRYWWEANGWGDRVKNVIAWMPLPEPYKEDEDTITVPVDKIYVLTKDDIKDIDPGDDVFVNVAEKLTQTISLVKEDQDKFIFEAIVPFLTEINHIVIPKRVLERALFTFKEEHAAEWKILMKEYGGTGI